MESPDTVHIAAVPVGPIASHNREVPTLDDAFHMLCQAMEARFADNMPAQMHAGEIMGWYDNGNVVAAWQHAVQLLEQVLDAKLSV